MSMRSTRYQGRVDFSRKNRHVLPPWLGGSQRGKVRVRQWGQAETGQDTVDRGRRDLSGGRDLQTDRPALLREVDQQTGSSLLGPSAPLISLPGEVEIGRKRPPMAEGDFQ